MTDNAIPCGHVVGITGIEALSDIGFKVVDEAIHDGDELRDAAIELLSRVVLLCPCFVHLIWRPMDRARRRAGVRRFLAWRMISSRRGDRTDHLVSCPVAPLSLQCALS